ncbi:MAG: ammonium transporter [Planctomycetia bacterium]|nr:ammonium transporter [Planctomycetia bacterium]
MRTRWFLVSALLITFSFIETNSARAEAPKTNSAPAPSVSELKHALEATQADLAATKKSLAEATSTADSATTTGKERGDTAWMLTASAFVMFMIPGLALFYGGMVRRKNVLATMMHSMAALAVVGVYWIAVGYSLAFGPSLMKVSILGVEKGGLVGWSWDLFFLKGIAFDQKLPGYDIPVYAHVIFQGMFAIIAPALISGAVAERIRFWPYCLFLILWVTFVYCPLAHMVWAFDWFDTSVLAAKRGTSAIGLLGKMGALDFAGGTVVHIAAGVAGLACCLVLGKRLGYPKQVAHPNSMVLTLLGAGLLWFGWFGFNGGSAVNSTAQAVSAFAATQAAAAAAGLGWMLIEWLHKGKPTALGLASGIVAGLVAVTPASGFVYAWAGIFIGLAAAGACYLGVALKNKLGYDDSLDAFGVHGVGGFAGAILTGVFATTAIAPAGGDGPFAYSYHRSRLEALPALIEKTKKESLEALDADVKADKESTLAALEKEKATLEEKIAKQDDTANSGKDKKSAMSQIYIQFKAAVFALVFALVLSLGLVYLTQAITRSNFKTDTRSESEGLDRTEHGEVGFDFSAATESVTVVSAEPRPASVPRGNGRFDLELTGASARELMKVWSDLCQPSDKPADPDFLAVYPHVTTIRGTTFRCRGGDPAEVAKRLEALFTRHTGKGVSAAKV